MLEITHHVEERKVKPRSIDERKKARIFCGLMLHENLPRQMKAMALEKLQQWGILNNSNYREILDNSDLYREIILRAKEVIAKAENFLESFNQSPWNFEPLEFEYAEEEIDSISNFPDLRNALNGNIRFLLRVQAGFFHIPIIQREDGKRQVFRTTETRRSIAKINEDIDKRPDLLPSFEIVPLREGEVCILIDWISGSPPKTESEKEACLLEAEKLLVIDPGDRSYDLYAGNFVISNEPDNKIYYIDGHIFEALVSNGLDPENSEIRRQKLEASKK